MAKNLTPANKNQLEITQQLEEKLKIKIPQEESVNWVTVGYVY